MVRFVSPDGGWRPLYGRLLVLTPLRPSGERQETYLAEKLPHRSVGIDPAERGDSSLTPLDAAGQGVLHP